MLTRIATPLINCNEVRRIYDECNHKKGYRAVFGTSLVSYLNTQGCERKIKQLLDNLPSTFKLKYGGDNWTNAFHDRCGTLWTTRFADVDALITLGLAIGRIRFTVPRDEWKHYPGGLPPFVYLHSYSRKGLLP